MNHKKLDEQQFNGHTIITIAKEEVLEAFDGDEDDGYHEFGTNWWTNKECPYAYKYLALDSLYPAPYFGEGIGHPANEQAAELYKYMQEVYSALFGYKFKFVIEFGTGGGEITQQFHTNNLDYFAVEGTSAGVKKMIDSGIDPNRIAHQNIKFYQYDGAYYDVAMCTEVAEHIEPWFASKVVEVCTKHADVVWFSAAKGTEPAHYHHINEVPIEAWDNIFAQFGYNNYVPLNGMMGRADRLYLSDEAIRSLLK